MRKITATLLILSSVLGVKADIMHKDIYIVGCSESDTNGEVMYGLDGEVLAYADFIKGKEVEPQPKFMDPITYGKDAYQYALGEQHTCKASLNNERRALKNPPLEQEEPASSIYPRDHVELGVNNSLICHVTGFYPAPVHVTWTRNNHNVTSDITVTVPYPNEDGTFYQFSRLKFRPEQGDIYSCTVHHLSLTHPETRVWDVDQIQIQSSVGPVVFCAVGLTLGLLGVAMGTFFLIKGNECN